MRILYGIIFLFALVPRETCRSIATSEEDAKKQWMYQSESKWDKEWKSGAWDYMEKVPVERSRVAVIGGVLIPMYAPKNASILDVGCGEGATADFLTDAQKRKYVGVELSKAAIAAAKSSRGHPMRFVHSAAHLFTPHQKFDAIVFADVLYYVEYEKVLRQYSEYLTPSGIIIISIFHFQESLMYENIFKFARTLLRKVDEIEVSGFTKKSPKSKEEKTAFHIEVFKLKSSPN